VTKAIMTDKRTQEHPEQGNMQKDPDDWVTGDEPMTGAQRSYLQTLSEEAKEEFDGGLTKAEASKRIEELQARTGRGVERQQSHSGAAPTDGTHSADQAAKDETPVKSLGEAVGEVVLGSETPHSGKR
jgi:hypothetical protein